MRSPKVEVPHAPWCPAVIMVSDQKAKLLPCAYAATPTLSK